MFEKCGHKWEVKDREVLESAFEQAKKHGILFEEFKGSFQVFQKTFVSVMVCTKCGKVEKTIVRSIE